MAGRVRSTLVEQTITVFARVSSSLGDSSRVGDESGFPRSWDDNGFIVLVLPELTCQFPAFLEAQLSVRYTEFIRVS